MGKLQPAEYYDAIYKNPKFGYQNHWSKSHYRRLWGAVLLTIKELLAGVERPNILELGSGPGQFASMLFEKLGGEDIFYNYRGLDFSEEAIKIAKKIVGKQFFHVADCLDPVTYQLHEADSASLVIAMEILEHTDDLKILSMIPRGKTVLITVPDFDDPAHVRHFKTEQEVRDRYSNLIEIGTLMKFERWYIITGVIKSPLA